MLVRNSQRLRIFVGTLCFIHTYDYAHRNAIRFPKILVSLYCMEFIYHYKLRSRLTPFALTLLFGYDAKIRGYGICSTVGATSGSPLMLEC